MTRFQKKTIVRGKTQQYALTPWDVGVVTLPAEKTTVWDNHQTWWDVEVLG